VMQWHEACPLKAVKKIAERVTVARGQNGDAASFSDPVCQY
jgi:hypothetical protein